MSRSIPFALLVFSMVISLPSRADSFYANADFQARYPGATAIHPGALEFVSQSISNTFSDGDVLIRAIQATRGLADAVARFPQLAPEAKLRVMRAVFELEVKSHPFAGPELVLDNGAKKETFFDFDPKTPGPGKVILNPTKLFADENPYAGLLFLIHETRHSYQFTLAFAPAKLATFPVVDAYRKGFLAQRDIFDTGAKASFCDFLTLNQEYEAFLYGNYVLEVLTQGAVKTEDMGTLASQFIPKKGLRLDLVSLARQVGPQALLGAFNELEKTQYDELHAPAAR